MGRAWLLLITCMLLRQAPLLPFIAIQISCERTLSMEGCIFTVCSNRSLSSTEAIFPALFPSALYVPCWRAELKGLLQLLQTNAPGKVAGPPGDAFELVYAGVASTVWHKVHEVDPVLMEYIRCSSFGRICTQTLCSSKFVLERVGLAQLIHHLGKCLL